VCVNAWCISQSERDGVGRKLRRKSNEHDIDLQLVTLSPISKSILGRHKFASNNGPPIDNVRRALDWRAEGAFWIAISTFPDFIDLNTIFDPFQEYRTLAEEHLKHDLTESDRSILETAARKVGMSSWHRVSGKSPSIYIDAACQASIRLLELLLDLVSGSSSVYVSAELVQPSTTPRSE
jgi:hypothetical protein